MADREKGSWGRFTEKELDYFRLQFATPYRSTVAFTDWLKRLGCVPSGGAVLDVGCGMGAVTGHFAEAFPQTRFIGIENNPQLVAMGNGFLAERGRPNVSLESGDLYHLEGRHGQADGLICTQTLSWLENAEKPLAAFAGTGCRWMALSSLFYDGPVSARIEITDHASRAEGRESRESYYNVYSIPRTLAYLETLGYGRASFQSFDIDIDLAAPPDKGMGTHTLELKTGRRLQVSGPVLMSWYFLYAERGPAHA